VVRYASRKNSEICIGFNQNIDKNIFQKALQDKTLTDFLHFENVQNGDVLEVPSGRIHSIGTGILLAEIQNTSDITYRIYDWGREYNPETARQMHVDLALDVVDYKSCKSYKTQYKPAKNARAKITENTHFAVNMLDFDRLIVCDYSNFDSFVAYMCVEGSAKIECESGNEKIEKGETLLIAAEIEQVKLIPNGNARLLEISVPT
jgi:mannose-6-phosphate isomerase